MTEGVYGWDVAGEFERKSERVGHTRHDKEKIYKHTDSLDALLAIFYLSGGEVSDKPTGSIEWKKKIIHAFLLIIQRIAMAQK